MLQTGYQSQDDKSVLMTPHDPCVPLLLQETQWSCYFIASLLLVLLTCKKQLEEILESLSEEV